MALGTTTVVILAATARGVLSAGWSKFRGARSGEPTPTRLVNGVYVPWGRKEKMDLIAKRLIRAFPIIWITIVGGAWLLLSGISFVPQESPRQLQVSPQTPSDRVVPLPPE